MATKKDAASQEAHVSGTHPAEDPDKEIDGHGLAVLKVSAGDKAPAEPLHTIAAQSDVFDPNAAYRNKIGVGPGLQDSEARNPAVWVDNDSDAARNAAADAEVQAAQRVLDRAQRRAEAIRAGDPLDNEAGTIRG